LHSIIKVLSTLSSPELLQIITISESGTGIAGDTFNVTCTVDVSMPPDVQWIYPNGNTVTNSSGIIVGPPVTIGNITNLTLTFNPLVTSHRGQYTCHSEVVIASSIQSENTNITVERELVGFECWSHLYNTYKLNGLTRCHLSSKANPSLQLLNYLHCLIYILQFDFKPFDQFVKCSTRL